MSEINQKEYKICIANCEYIAPCHIKFVQIDCKNKKDGVCNDTCFIKQLQRLKQENEKLTSNYENLYQNAKQLYNQYNKYGGNKENELVEIINKTTDERNKYRQTLEEIKEIYRLTCRDCEYALSCEIENCGNYKLIMIKKTVNEVLND